MTAMHLETEPVRGGYPPPGYFALFGLEQARAMVDGLVPRPPFYRLLGIRLTHAAPGSATLTMPASPWLLARRAFTLLPLVEAAHQKGALTVSPAASLPGFRSMAMNFLRRPTVEMENFVAKARVIMAGPLRVTTEVTVEDAAGRLILQSTAQLAYMPIEPAPPAGGSLERFEEPTYLTPDPTLRPLTLPAEPVVFGRRFVERARAWLREDRVPIARFQLMGERLVEIDEGEVTLAMAASEWLCSERRKVVPATHGLLFDAASWATLSVIPEAMGGFAMHSYESWILSSGEVGAPPDGREWTARGKVVYADHSLIISDAEGFDADGELTSLSRSTATVLSAEDGAEVHALQRVLATVLFADVVGSTTTVERIGDTRWRDVLQQNLALIRREIASSHGREVKTEGDGFLATFDSPARAVKCARAVRDGLRRQGLEIRAGLHLGEIELIGADVAGIAVHVASRVESVAEPGAILVTSTLREAVTGPAFVSLTAERTGSRALRRSGGSTPLRSDGDT